MSESVEDLQKTALGEKDSVELKTPVSNFDSAELVVVSNQHQLASMPTPASVDEKPVVKGSETSGSLKRSQPPGMIRRRLTLATTALLAFGVFAFNMTDLRPLIEQEGTIDRNFVFSPKSRLPELPIDYKYVNDRESAGQEFMSIRRDIDDNRYYSPVIGFADAHGSIVIPPKFEMARSFSDGLCAIQDSSRNHYWSYIDRTGNIVMRPLYDSARDFSDGRAVVTQKGRSFLIDKYGGILPPGECHFIDEYPGSLYVVSRANSRHYGVIKGSKFVIPEVYDDITALNEASSFRYFALQKGTNVTLADSNGHTYFSKYNCTICSVDGSLVRISRDGLYGFCDLSGNTVVEPKYKLMTAPDKLIAVKNGSKIHFINAQGKDVPSVAVDSVVVEAPVSLKWLHDGLGLFRRAGLYGYIDESGREVISPKFISASSFHDGVACVDLGSRKAYIDRSGNLVNDKSYLDAKSFDNGKAVVTISGPLCGLLEIWSKALGTNDRNSHVFRKSEWTKRSSGASTDALGTTFGDSRSNYVFELE